VSQLQLMYVNMLLKFHIVVFSFTVRTTTTTTVIAHHNDKSVIW